ncbi:hypothetical protein F5Y13DRAFT_201917 [Hypoxylon sp. FL1857]|nr:hypothetical protein F5Y13DRAFT_201917 [Hypoxylon sp. FL1857]
MLEYHVKPIEASHQDIAQLELIPKLFAPISNPEPTGISWRRLKIEIPPRQCYGHTYDLPWKPRLPKRKERNLGAPHGSPPFLIFGTSCLFTILECYAAHMAQWLSAWPCILPDGTMQVGSSPTVVTISKSNRFLLGGHDEEGGAESRSEVFP